MGFGMNEQPHKVTERDLDERQGERERFRRDTNAVQAGLLDRRRSNVIRFVGAMKPVGVVPVVPTRRGWWQRLREWMREGLQ